MLVLAQIFDSAPAANIAMGMLKTNGINCILDGEIAYGVFGIQLTPTNGIRLMVNEEDLPQAQALLAEHHDN